MRDDFQIPNLGQAPQTYQVSFFNRMIRNVEMTFETLRAKGTATFTTINAEVINVSSAGTQFITSVFVTGAAGTARLLGFLTGNLNRWLVSADATAESGGNAGSDFAIYRYDDAGAFLGQPFYIQRSTGDIYLERDLSAGRALIATTSVSGATVAATTTVTAGTDAVVGRGVQFPATQVPSADPNNLDDYEEGTWTPTITSGTGTITTASATGVYTKIGRTVFVEISVTITTNGTGASWVVATLPFTPAVTFNVIAGRNTTTGNLLQGFTTISPAAVSIVNYNNTYPAASGQTLALSGTYRV